MSILVEHTSTYDATAISALEGFSSELNRMPLAASKANPMTDREMARHAKITQMTGGYLRLCPTQPWQCGATRTSTD